MICFELEGVPHNRLAQLLAENGGVATRGGCFCVNMFVKQLLGIGRIKNGLARTGLALLPRTTQGLLTGLVRISFGLTNRQSEVDRLVEVLQQIAREKPRRLERVLARHHFGTPRLPESHRVAHRVPGPGPGSRRPGLVPQPRRIEDTESDKTAPQ